MDKCIYIISKRKEASVSDAKCTVPGYQRKSFKKQAVDNIVIAICILFFCGCQSSLTTKPCV